MDPSSDSGSESGPMDTELTDTEIQELETKMSELLNFLGKKHTLAIQRQFAYSDGPLRFTDLEEALDISPNTLSDRLKEFTETGLLIRDAYNEIPPRVEYRMTEKSRDLKPIFRHLSAWVAHHELGSAVSDDESTQAADK